MPVEPLKRILAGTMAALAGAALALAPSGCGGAGPAPSSSSAAAAKRHTHQFFTEPSAAAASARVGGYSRLDGDSDDDDEHPLRDFGNDDAPLFATYGRGAGAAGSRAIAALVKAYYAALASGDTARACSLLSPGLASVLPGQYGLGPHGRCADAMALVLREQRPRLLAENVPTMRIDSVHARGSLGLAVVSFMASTERQITLEREGRGWKIDTPFDNAMP